MKILSKNELKKYGIEEFIPYDKNQISILFSLAICDFDTQKVKRVIERKFIDFTAENDYILLFFENGEIGLENYNVIDEKFVITGEYVTNSMLN